MLLFENSEKLIIYKEQQSSDSINVIYQYFIHSNPERQREIRYTLQQNCTNTHIDVIYLINERMFTEAELGIQSPKIKQIIIGNRLKFKDVFDVIESNKIQGYNVIVNADIFVDDTICKLRHTDIHKTKSMIALLRYEFNPSNKEAKIFGPRPDSQDTWILHSNQSINAHQSKIFNFEFGKPGCDNKVIYLMYLLGYSVYNTPRDIRTYHVHSTNIRNYTTKDTLSKPLVYCHPYDLRSIPDQYRNIQENFSNKRKCLAFTVENDKLRDYISHKFHSLQNFIVPRIAGIENNFAVIGNEIMHTNRMNPVHKTYIDKATPTMKNNAGIKITCQESLTKYSQMYISAFMNCDIYADWEPWGNVYQKSQDTIQNICKKDTISAWVFDIFNYIHSNPWTNSLKGKRILLISPFEESLKTQIPKREKIYGIDLFPECTFTIIKPPQTQGQETSKEFDIELELFFKTLGELTDEYDVALVSAGGYGTLICDYIYTNGKSAIYVGGVLQMYFGIYGQRWLRERKEILNLYLNNHWLRPMVNEKPKDYTNVKGSCYW